MGQPLKEPNKKDIEMMNKFHKAKKNGDFKTVEEVQIYFLSSLKAFVYLKIKSMAGGFMKDHFQDLVQECYAAIIENLDEFDPTLGTRTTWATPYITHAIFRYTTIEGKRSSLYFGNMATKVNQAISKCNKLDIKPTIEILARMTGLPYNKAEEALKTLTASKECHFEGVAEFDTQYNYSFEESPEDQVIEKIVENNIQSILTESLTPIEEKCFRLNRYDEHLTYSKISKMLDIPASTVSSYVASAEQKIKKNPKFRKLAKRYESKYERVEEKIGIEPLCISQDTDINQVLQNLCPFGEVKVKNNSNAKEIKKEPEIISISF